MKRRYYKIHHYNYARPMKRVKRRHIVWSSVLLAVLALLLVAVGVLAVLKWIRLGSGRGAKKPALPTQIPIYTEGVELTTEPPVTEEPTAEPTATPTSVPTAVPTAAPTPEPTEEPTPEPTEEIVIVGASEEATPEPTDDSVIIVVP